MKKYAILFLLIIAISFYSCSRNSPNDIPVEIVLETEEHEYEDISYTVGLYARNLHEAIQIGDIDYIQRYIKNFNRFSWLEYKILSNNDLRILRNTIFAMHGQIFRTRDLQEHFQRFEWYHGIYENVEHELSANELRLIRIILAMEAANPPSRDDIIGTWVTTVPGVENIGFVPLYLGADGRMEVLAGSILDRPRGYWYLEGTTFRTRPADGVDVENQGMWMVVENWFDEFENLRIVIFEHNGELYKTTVFFDGGNLGAPTWWYQEYNKPPLEFWN